MKVAEVRKIISEMGLSDEADIRIKELLSEFADNQDLDDPRMQKILDIVDLEIESNETAAQVYRAGGQLCDEMLNRLNDASNEAADELGQMINTQTTT